MEELDLFNYAVQKSSGGEKELLQSVLAWLTGLGCSGWAVKVPTKRARLITSVAAFFRGKGKNNPVSETLLVEICPDLSSCFKDYGAVSAVLPEWRQLGNELKRLEKQIRENEPELASRDVLFDELRCWDYSSSKNPEYKAVRKRFSELQHLLDNGNRLERLNRAKVADYCYLAAPDVVVSMADFLPGWGLLALESGHRVKEVRQASRQSGVTAESRLNFALRIAQSAALQVNFAYGVDFDGSRTILRGIPRKRRVLQKQEKL